MSKHGPRYVTAFNDEETSHIRYAIRRLAQNHNRLIRDTLEIDIVDWRNAVLPPELRELAVQTQQAYPGQLISSSYDASFVVPGATFHANWARHPDLFPRPVSLGAALHTDRAAPFVERLTVCLKEWLAAATDYGMALDVFDWLNGKSGSKFDFGFCGKGERRHLRTLLPTVAALVAKSYPELARTLTPIANRPAPPAEHVAAIVKANQIIAGALLLPEYPVVGHHISLSLISGHVGHPLWFRKFEPLTQTS